jgi:hypothetical protein
MNNEYMEAKGKSGRIWGWILTISGGVCTLPVIYMIWIVIHSYYKTKGEYGLLGSDVFPLYLLISIPLLCTGIPVLLLGIWRLFLVREGKRRRIWGWVSAILGFILLSIGLFILGGSLFGGVDINKIYIYYCFVILLMNGVLCIIPGVREIIREERTPSEYQNRLDNPQGEVKNENRK